MGDGVGAEDVGNINGERTEIGTASDKGGDRHNDVIYEGFDDGGESAADCNTDGEVNDVAAVDKFCEFTEEGKVHKGFDGVVLGNIRENVGV